MMIFLTLFYHLVLLSACVIQVAAESDTSSPDISKKRIKHLTNEVIVGVVNAKKCSDCESPSGLLTLFKKIAELGNEAFDEVLTQVCILSGAEDPDVCKGVLAAEGPIIAHVLRKVELGSHTAKLLCTNLLGLCEYPVPRLYKVSFPKPKPNKQRPKPSGKKPLQVAHISDTHVDLEYETGASYKCSKPICCRPYDYKDAPGNATHPCGPYGNPACDAPLRLETNMFSAIEDIVKPEFTIYTGDVVAHDIWLVNKPEVIKDLDTTFGHMDTLKLVYPSVGNHDTAPCNAFPLRNLGDFADNQWTYDNLASNWKKWIGEEAAASVQKDGAYSALLKGTKLRIISFNSIFYYTLNFWMYEKAMPYDPDGQLAWMVKELQAAEDAGERVWLIAHIPTGSVDFFRDYSDYLDQIVNRYEATIAALFYGHTHVDQFEIAYSDYTNRTYSNAVAMSYITPSMTPTSGSPAFRAYTVDPETFAVLDFTQYIANISSPQFQQKPVWKKYYSAKETYGPLVHPPLTDPKAELTPAFWHNVTTAFVHSDAQFQAYYDRKTRGYEPTICNGTCKHLEICQLRAAQSQYNCQTTTPGLHFSKREPGMGHDLTDACGESRLRHIFRSLTRPTAEVKIP